MQIKRYEAVSTSEAMEKIKTDLGPDAVVLSTRRLRGGIEVVAARDTLDLGSGNGEMMGSDMLTLFKTEIDQLKTLIHDFRREGNIYAELAELKESVGALFDVLGVQRNESIPSSLSKVYYHLISVGISKERACALRACALIEGLKNTCSPDDLENYHQTLGVVEDAIRRSITPSYKSPKKKRLSAFVGPAGEGKTTTLAKVAARSLLGEKSSVGVITMDTYRIGAAQQLKIYTDIMDVPMEVASEKKEFERALNVLSDRDVILIDTPGRSRDDEEYLLRLKEWCGTDLPLEMNLVLSMTSSQENMMDAASGFGSTNYDNIILTKLDDSRKFGSMYNVIDAVGKPVSYIADGQDVPRDLKEMNPARLARLIVENRLN
ncbi:MAG: flagellar biosynthesis protein FlhF [Deltaproteobacteria bacterium]|nr:flagellar biosynthesis protein FlhF [Deltaproteobacteria bacterium]